MHMESCREVGPETACISLLMTSLVRFQQMELHVGIALKEELCSEILQADYNVEALFHVT